MPINTDTLKKAVTAVVEDYRGRNYFPSAAVRVFTPDHTICQAAAGDVREDTVFDVASLSKIATATQILTEVEKGVFGLSSGILDVMPSLAEHAILRERLGAVSIKSLLTHTSGITAWYPFYSQTGDFISVLATALEQNLPVEGMVYSDLNFMILGKVLEARYGLPLDKCLEQNLVLPLGLGRMTYRPDLSWDIAPSGYGNPHEEEMCAERGIAFSQFRSGKPIRGQVHDGNAYYYFNGAAGHAGIFADTAAYEKLCQFYLNTKSSIFLEAQEDQAEGRGLGFQLGW
jgi:CubicO group peptidase (beta-lactamase class C family)